MEINNKELKVKAIENGTVIDHIPASKLFDVINILELSKLLNPMTFSSNFDSTKLGKKAIIKIWNHKLIDKEVNKLTLIAPNAKINIIENYKVVEKMTVSIPDTIEGIVKCMNPKCITNCEKVSTRFSVINDKPIALRCHYCEKMTDQENMKIK